MSGWSWRMTGWVCIGLLVGGALERVTTNAMWMTQREMEAAQRAWLDTTLRQELELKAVRAQMNHLQRLLTPPAPHVTASWWHRLWHRR